LLKLALHKLFGEFQSDWISRMISQDLTNCLSQVKNQPLTNYFFSTVFLKVAGRYSLFR